MNPDLEIRLTVRMPMGGKTIGVSFKVSEHTFLYSFAPLPSDRELPFAVIAQRQAARQKQMRRDIAKDIAMQMAVKLLELIESEDPQNGYSPEEWRRINEEAIQ